MELKLEKINAHERDKRILFDEEPHIYYIDGSSDNISTTTFIHTLFSPFNADEIIKKMMNSKKWSGSPYFGMTSEEIKKKWSDNGKIASSAGTLMHRDIEYYYNDIEVNNDSSEYNYFLKFKEDFNYLKPFRTEWVIFDDDLKLSGSVDMVFYNTKNNTYEIYDWKRTKEIKKFNSFSNGNPPVEHLPDCNYWHYSLQLNIYRKILETKYNLPISKLCLVVCHPNQKSYQRIETPIMDVEVMDIFEKRLNDINNL